MGLGLLATQALWVPRFVEAILAHEGRTVVIQAPDSATTTPAKSVTHPGKPPVPTPTPVVTGGVDAIVTVGPTCPVQKDPPDPQCADKPYQTMLVLATTIIGKNGGVLVFSDAQGHFSRDLAPGTYTLRAQSSDPLPRLAPMTFEVKEGTRTKLTVQFDSGIR
jgi:hypothetical protein